MPGTDNNGTLGRPYRLFDFSAKIVGIILGIASVGFLQPVAAADYWQLQSNGITVIAEGSKADAIDTATSVFLLQSAARWMVDGPPENVPRASLVFALSSATIDEYFPRQQMPNRFGLGGQPRQGFVMGTPSLLVVAFSRNRTRGAEFSQLQMLYGGELMASGPSAQWPECVRGGMAVLLAAADLRQHGQLHIKTDRVSFPIWYDAPPLPPRDFIRASDSEQVSDYARDRRSYSCYVLATMALRGEPIPRSAFVSYFKLIGAGAAFDEAAQSAFQMSDTQFTEELLRYAALLRSQSRAVRLIHADIGAALPMWPEPEQLSAERARNILTQLAAKMRGQPAPAEQ